MTRTGRQRGFALLTVLWTLGFLALLGTALAGMARQATQRVDNMLAGAMAEAASDGALHQAIFAMLDPSERRWRADGGLHLLASGPHRIELRIDDETGKVNPNLASVELLQALAVQVGAEPRVAAALAAAIVDWRSRGSEGNTRAAQYAAAGRDYAPPGTPFERLEELAAVLGMTPALFERLRPHLTLFTRVDPDASTGDPVVYAALGAPPRPTAATRVAGDGIQVATVGILVRGPRRTAFAERVVVRTNSLTDIRRFEILSREPVATRD